MVPMRTPGASAPLRGTRRLRQTEGGSGPGSVEEMAHLRASLREDLRRVVAPASRAPTLPPECYRSADVLAAERETLFRRTWIGCGRADRWRAPGDWASLEIGGVPVLVVRDRAGTLRAFANTCRHRGTRLLEGAGNATHIACPFHAWTYGLDGTLRAAPRMGRAEGFDRAENGLIPFRIGERAGFVFVNLDADAAGLDAWLGDFESVHAPWPLARLVTTRRRELEVPCNWKLFLEVFNEYYHLPAVHGRTFGSVYREPDPPEATGGAFATQFGLTAGTGGLRHDGQDHALPAMPGLDGRHRRGTRYSWVFPAMTFAAGTEALWVYEARPLDPGRCHVAMSVCFPPETVEAAGFEARAAHYYRRMDDALDEDIAVLGEQQAGMASPWARAGRYGDLEPCVALFAFWYAAELTA